MSDPNYSKLVEQGRAKSHGTTWSDEEMKLLVEITRVCNFPDFRKAAQYMRRGAKSVEDVEKLKAEDVEVKEQETQPVTKEDPKDEEPKAPETDEVKEPKAPETDEVKEPKAKLSKETKKK